MMRKKQKQHLALATEKMSSGSLKEVFRVYRVSFLQVTIIFADSVIFSSKRKPEDILWHRDAIMLIPPNSLRFLPL